jgi:hypothetical protein
MIPTAETYIRIAVEGASDEEMARKLMRHAGLTVSHVLVKKGSGELDKVIPRLAKTTVNDPWVVFRDADTACPVELRRQLIGDRPHDGAFELRFPTSMTEAWFLADAIGFAAHFRITRGRIPAVPDDLEHAKRSLLGLCQQSKSRALREDVVRPSGRPGPLYVLRMNEFAKMSWDIERASEHSPSLRRTVNRLSEMRSLLTSGYS